MSAADRTATLAWRPDVLDGFSAAAVADATLVRPDSLPVAPRAAVVYVHGYNDYFFQSHVAEAFASAGYAFYAVDLPRAGRSLRPGDIPHFMTDVSEQGDAIAAAVGAVGSLHPEIPVVAYAHSTGGLTTAMWAKDRPHPGLAAVVLNSPFLGLRASRAARALGRIVLPVLGRLAPRRVVAGQPSVYAAHQHRSAGGQWDFDPAWKRPTGVPGRAGFLLAVLRAHARIRRGLDINVPVLVARAAQSGKDLATNPKLREQDTVLDVADIARMTPKLGKDVTELVYDGAVHDISLSSPEVRTAYLDHVLRWLDERLP